MYKIPANTLFVGQALVFMPECHSTNDELSRLLQTDSPAEGTVIITDNQTAGRGQRGNTWLAAPGQNLTFSLLFRPTFLHPREQFMLSKSVALAIRDCCRQFVSNVHIKWPNDILIGDQKVCGVLIENQLAGQRLTSAVVGIGLNVNQEQFGLPTATSLRNQTGQPIDRADLLTSLLHYLESYYLHLRQGGGKKIDDAYHEALYWIGEHHYFATDDAEWEGVITGVDPTGRLVIDTPAGTQSFDIKGVRYVR